MDVIKQLFPAKARRKVASTDWSVPSNVTIVSSEDFPVTVCPIGMALLICGEIAYEPTPLAAERAIESNPDKFNKPIARKLSEDFSLEREVRIQFGVFMDAYDRRTLTNADIAEAFGYPELARS